MLSLVFYMMINVASIAEKIHNPRVMKNFSAMMAAFIIM
jgi:hypothetical protein